MPRSPHRPTSPACGTRDDNALVDPARLAWGLADTAERLGVRIHEDTRGRGPRQGRPGTGRDGRSHAGTAQGPGRAGRARHQRLPLAGQAGALAHRAGLRLRADDRAAHRRAARVHRLAEPPGHRRQRQPVPLLPADRRQPDPVGRLRRDLPLRRPGHAELDDRPETFELLAGTSSRPSRSWRASASPTQWGGAIDTCTRFFAFFGTAYAGPGRVRRRVHRSRCRRDPLRRERDARPARRPRDGAYVAAQMVRSKPLPFPPEPFAWPASSSPGGRWPRPTATAAGATCGCGRSTGMGLGFDS